MKPSPLPERPWQNVGVDAFELDGKKYVVVIDYYSRYPEIAYVPNLITSTVIAKLKSMFARWGIPEFVISDNGPSLGLLVISMDLSILLLVHILHKRMEKQKVG